MQKIKPNILSVYDPEKKQWTNVPAIIGPQGEAGPQGKIGPVGPKGNSGVFISQNINEQPSEEDRVWIDLTKNIAVDLFSPETLKAKTEDMQSLVGYDKTTGMLWATSLSWTDF